MAHKNKFGITKSKELMPIEERISKVRARELFDDGLISRVEPTFAGLAAVHKHLFSDIYDFAGQMRDVDVTRGNVRFTPIKNLKTELDFIDIMPYYLFDDIVNKYIEMNIAHPFKAGNGRAMRIWLNAMLSQTTNSVIDWSKIDKRAFRAALDQSSIDDEPIFELFKSAVTRDLSRETYLKGVDASFAFEGYDSYIASEL